jgi:hypothetical protein
MSKPSSKDSDALLTPQELQSVSNAELFDQDGRKITFGDLTRGKRIVLVFIRHFCVSISPCRCDRSDQDVTGCKNCQAYVSHLGKSIPPQNLPEKTSGNRSPSFTPRSPEVLIYT